MEVERPATERIEARGERITFGRGREMSGASRQSEWRILRNHIEMKNI
jgi:hypothetical protein